MVPVAFAQALIVTLPFFLPSADFSKDKTSVLAKIESFSLLDLGPPSSFQSGHLPSPCTHSGHIMPFLDIIIVGRLYK